MEQEIKYLNALLRITQKELADAKEELAQALKREDTLKQIISKANIKKETQ